MADDDPTPAFTAAQALAFDWLELAQRTRPGLTGDVVLWAAAIILADLICQLQRDDPAMTVDRAIDYMAAAIAGYQRVLEKGIHDAARLCDDGSGAPGRRDRLH
jgi:hypothetical protein